MDVMKPQRRCAMPAFKTLVVIENLLFILPDGRICFGQ